MKGTDTKIYESAFVGPNVTIGNGCRIQAFAFIPDNVEIGNDVFIGPHVCFTNDKYPSSHGAWKETPKTVVGDGVVIGAGAIILPSLRLGAGCKIAAGAIVTRDIEPKTIVAGSPAREIRSDW